MASAATSAVRRIPPPRIYANIPRRRFSSTTISIENHLAMNDENNVDHEKCLIEQNQLQEVNRRQLARIELLERDYRQLDDDLAQLQLERDLLIKQKRLLEEEIDRSSHHASANLDLHVYTQRLEDQCRELQCEITVREKEKFELNEIIADLEVQIKQIRDRQEECQETCNELEGMLASETENRQCLELQLTEANRREKENGNRIQRLQSELDEITTKNQDIVKSNFALVQNAESLREQLRLVRTQVAEVHMIRASSSSLFENLDESISCLGNTEAVDDDLVLGQSIFPDSSNGQSSLFNEINSIETLSDELVSKYLDGTSSDIEVDLLLSKTTTLSSIIPLINQLGVEVKYLHDSCYSEQDHLINMKNLLKRVLETIQTFDARFRKLQILLMASREQQQCYQAELDDFFRLVDKRIVPDLKILLPTGENQPQRRLLSIFEAYEQEFNRLRQRIRDIEETNRSHERESLVHQTNITRWRMKATALEKNQRKLVDKIKEIESERRQLIETTNQRRTRRRAMPIVQIEQPQPSKPIEQPVSRPVFPSVSDQPLKRSRSVPCLKCVENGRKSRNDSGVVLNDDWLSQYQSISIHTARRRIKSQISSQFVLHTSPLGYSMPKNSNSSWKKYSGRFQWFFLVFLFVFLLLSSMKVISMDDNICHVLCPES